MSGPLGTSGGGAAGVTSVTAGNGITVTGTTTPTIAASLAAGTGIGISGTTTLSISNSGVTALAGTGISVSAATGSVTVTPTYAAPTALTIGGTVVTGAAASVANSAHAHAMPGSAVAGASAVGDTAATGSATTVALSDHRHSREAFGTPVVVNGQTTALATGSLTTLARADHVHTVSNVPVLLASATLTSAAISYTFSSIPQTYKHLELSYMGKSVHNISNDPDLMYLLFNGDTAANYRSSFSPSTPRTSLPVIGLINSGTSFLSSQPCEGTIRIYHYANTTNGWYKQAINTWNYEAGFATGSAYTAVWYESWDITNTAISTVTINLVRANWAAGTQFALYGYP